MRLAQRHEKVPRELKRLAHFLEKVSRESKREAREPREVMQQAIVPTPAPSVSAVVRLIPSLLPPLRRNHAWGNGRAAFGAGGAGRLIEIRRKEVREGTLSKYFVELNSYDLRERHAHWLTARIGRYIPQVISRSRLTTDRGKIEQGSNQKGACGEHGSGAPPDNRSPTKPPCHTCATQECREYFAPSILALPIRLRATCPASTH
jgi:hypothetical protein